MIVMPRLTMIFGAAVLAVVLLSTSEVHAQKPAMAQTMDPMQKCVICHGKRGFKKVLEDGSIKELHVNEAALKRSVHAKKQCNDCHFDVKEIPHRTTPQKVKCVHCHYKGNPEGAPDSDMYLQYEQSVHGKASKAGKSKAPVCQDCHGSHDIKKIDDPLSTVAHFKVAQTCGKCHLDEYADYRKSIHGVAVYEQNNPDAPDCTGCHGEHDIIKHDDPASKVFTSNISHSCSKCHAEEGIVGKYGIEAEQVDTFEESFHGVAGKFGSRTVANCASCHGVHDILGPDNPESSVFVDNIPKTCGKCHPGANANYAKGKMHVNPKKKEAGVIFWVGFALKWLTIMTLMALIAHIILDLNRKSKEFRKITRRR